MAASSIVVLPSPGEIARRAAAAIPSEISTRPLLGILGVVIGAGLVTLTGRMLSLGLADLKGHVGISFDNGAWLDSAYNASLMFIGPFTVYLGGLLGPRRILLFAAGIFALACLFLPLIHSYSLLIVVLVIAGLTSGTFYPLTLTFALRNIPLRYLPFTIALYAIFVDGAVNIAPSLYGWYRNHLSWEWMFWNSAVIAPVMMVCIYYGIPAMPPRKKEGPAPSFAGFLYVSAGLAILLLFNKVNDSIGVVPECSTPFSARIIFPALRADSKATCSQFSGGTAVYLEVEHPSARLPALLVPLHSVHNDYSYSTVARHTRVRGRSDWACDHLECRSTAAGRVYRCASVAAQV